MNEGLNKQIDTSKKIDPIDEKINEFIDKVAKVCDKMMDFAKGINRGMLSTQLKNVGFDSSSIQTMKEVFETQDPKLVMKYIGLCLQIYPKNKDNIKEKGGEIDE